MNLTTALAAVLAMTVLAGCSVSAARPEAARARNPEVSMAALAPSDVNYHRRRAGLVDLVRSRRADAAARGHASDMAEGGFFSHLGSNGSTHSARLRRAGCGGGAENIAMGSIYDRSNIIQAWMASPGHRSNILLPAARYYGLARAGDHWVMTLSANC